MVYAESSPHNLLYESIKSARKKRISRKVEKNKDILGYSIALLPLFSLFSFLLLMVLLWHPDVINKNISHIKFMKL